MFKETSKKAQFGTALTAIFSSIALFLVIIIFVILSSIISGSISGGLIDNAESIMLKERAQESLITYLKSPVQVDINNIKQEITVADLIRLTQDDEQDTYKTILELKTKRTFSSLFESYEFYAGYTTIKGGQFKRISEKVSMNLPLGTEETIEVGLIVGK